MRFPKFRWSSVRSASQKQRAQSSGPGLNLLNLEDRLVPPPTRSIMSLTIYSRHTSSQPPAQPVTYSFSGLNADPVVPEHVTIEHPERRRPPRHQGRGLTFSGVAGGSGSWTGTVAVEGQWSPLRGVLDIAVSDDGTDTSGKTQTSLAW